MIYERGVVGQVLGCWASQSLLDVSASKVLWKWLVEKRIDGPSANGMRWYGTMQRELQGGGLEKQAWKKMKVSEEGTLAWLGQREQEIKGVSGEEI